MTDEIFSGYDSKRSTLQYDFKALQLQELETDPDNGVSPQGVMIWINASVYRSGTKLSKSMFTRASVRSGHGGTKNDSHSNHHDRYGVTVTRRPAAAKDPPGQG